MQKVIQLSQQRPPLMVGLVLVIALIPFSAQGIDHLSKKGKITEPDRVTKIRISETYGKLPLHFEANQGQVDERVRFLSRGSGYNLLLTSNEAVCSTNPLQFCPDSPITRGQMAVFLIASLQRSPNACSGRFGDVPSGDAFCGFIERLADDGITGGCGGGNYCPNDPVTRAQMAVFLVAAPSPLEP